MLRATPADPGWRRVGLALVAVIVAASAFVVGPSAPKAEALPSPCNLPGGSYLCKKAVQGVEWVQENVPGAKQAGSAIDAAASVADFATDPLGYIDGKLRGGAKTLFQAFGEELTGKKVDPPAKTRKQQ